MLKLSGNIYKNGTKVGSYSCSFLSCSYSYEIEGCTPSHFWHEDELENWLDKNGYRYDKKGDK